MPDVQVNNTNLPPSQTPPPDLERRSSSTVLPVVIVVVVAALLLVFFIFSRADRGDAKVDIDAPEIEVPKIERKIEVETPEVDVNVPDKVDVDVNTSTEKPAP